MKNSRRSLRSLSVDLGRSTNDGDVKMNSSSLDLLELLAQRLEGEDRERRRRDAHLRARRDLALRSSPSSALTLSMISTDTHTARAAGATSERRLR